MYCQRQFPVGVVMLELDADVSRLGVSDGIGQAFLRAAVDRQIDRVAIAGLKASGADAKRDLRMPAAVIVHELIDELGKRNIAFLCARESTKAPRLGPDLKTAFGGVYIANEGLSYDEAQAVVAAGEADAVAFGKLFISNPDLPRRFASGAPLNDWNANTFYSEGPVGYTDYPALTEKAAAE